MYFMSILVSVIFKSCQILDLNDFCNKNSVHFMWERCPLFYCATKQEKCQLKGCSLQNICYSVYFITCPIIHLLAKNNVLI